MFVDTGVVSKIQTYLKELLNKNSFQSRMFSTGNSRSMAAIVRESVNLFSFTLIRLEVTNLIRSLSDFVSPGL